jgi:phosphoribosylformimino-5-aminoimidazole carboxamide ribonucleotide (ProFAR) isomerase
VNNRRWMLNENGKRVAVLLDVKEYKRLVDELKELADIRAYDEAVAELKPGERELITSIKRSGISRKGGFRWMSIDALPVARQA